MATKLLLLEEVSERLRLDPAAVRELIRRGQLYAIILPPDLIRVAPQHLQRFLRARSTALCALPDPEGTA